MGWIFESNRPIYTQLLEQIQIRIVCGAYGPGDRLPPVRELAQEAAVNPNTMQKALSELERTGLIYAQRTAGRFVTDNADLIQNCRRQITMEKIEAFLKSMQELGYGRKEVETLMKEDGPWKEIVSEKEDVPVREDAAGGPAIWNEKEE